MAAKKQKEYRLTLKQELDRRIRRNSQYTMRSFARDLGLSPSLLSCVLRRKLDLSEKTAQSIASKLKLPEEEQSAFVAAVTREKANKKIARNKPKVSREFDLLSRDKFLFVSEWYHFAILELTYLEDFVPDTKWIAGRLGITVHESQEAVERLQNLKLLRILRGGRYKPTTDWTFASSGVSSEGIKRFHSQILKKADDALFKQDVERRHFSGGIQAINIEDLPEAKKEIDGFIKEFLEKYGRRKSKNAVYSISTQLFRADKSQSEFS